MPELVPDTLEVIGFATALTVGEAVILVRTKVVLLRFVCINLVHQRNMNAAVRGGTSENLNLGSVDIVA